MKDHRTLLLTGLLALLAACGEAPQATPALFTNTASIGIPDSGPASPSTINVSGVTGTVTRVNVTLFNVNHGYAGDINVLLVGPTGQTLLLMADTSGSAALTDTTLSFDDAAPPLPLYDIGPAAGTYRPTDYDSFPGLSGYDDDHGGSFDSFPAPAPAGPYGSTLGGFNSLDPNGIWSLYVLDDGVSDSGSVAGGWSLSLTTGNGSPTIPPSRGPD